MISTFWLVIGGLALFVFIGFFLAIDAEENRKIAIKGELKKHGGGFSSLIKGFANDSFVGYNKNKHLIVAGTLDSDCIKESLQVENFEITSFIHNMDLLKANTYTSQIYIAFSNTQQQMLIIHINSLAKTIIDFSSIISVEMIVNDQITYKKSTRTTIGRTLLGGLLGGDAGAIVAGTTGETLSQKQITSLCLRILVKNVDQASYTINWFENGVLDLTCAEDKKIFDRCQKIKDTIVVILDLLEEQEEDDKIDPSFSVAEELLKFAELKEKGLITEEEFEKQKKVLLSKKR